ncbi:hypothetical protein CLOM_g12633 [Closterium sp. NIES-68]|nr:hypothetical protein CLOM_g12633 [Closterium sp. NIES-68]
MARAAPEEVVGQPGVKYLGLVGAVAIAWGWEREAEAEGEGDGKVRRSEAERREDGDGVEPIPCPVTRQREQALSGGLANPSSRYRSDGVPYEKRINGSSDRRGEPSMAVMIAPRSTLLNAFVRSTWTITERGRTEVKARVAWIIASPPLRIATPN